MYISKVGFEILNLPDMDAGIDLLKRVEYIARISHRTEDRITEDSYDRFIRSVVLTHGDFSVIEHCSVTVEAEIDRGISHEWVRHRIAAYTQESTRFVNYAKGVSQLRFIEPPFKNGAAKNAWLYLVTEAEREYRNILASGEPPELARSVLPTCTGTKLVATYDLRTWRHFFIMRTCREAHPQMKLITLPLLEAFKARIPILYEDIQPEMRQADAMRLLR